MPWRRPQLLDPFTGHWVKGCPVVQYLHVCTRRAEVLFAAASPLVGSRTDQGNLLPGAPVAACVVLQLELHLHLENLKSSSI